MDSEMTKPSNASGEVEEIHRRSGSEEALLVGMCKVKNEMSAVNEIPTRDL